MVAAITGIPFVSPQVVNSKNDPLEQLRTRSAGFEIPDGAAETQRERTATRFWKHVPHHFVGLPRPLTWNIYPFWPFELNANGIVVNRAPTRKEIVVGLSWLHRLIDMYP